jgi:hypothetical protein
MTSFLYLYILDGNGTPTEWMLACRWANQHRSPTVSIGFLSGVDATTGHLVCRQTEASDPRTTLHGGSGGVMSAKKQVNGHHAPQVNGVTAMPAVPASGTLDLLASLFPNAVTNTPATTTTPPLSVVANIEERGATAMNSIDPRDAHIAARFLCLLGPPPPALSIIQTKLDHGLKGSRGRSTSAVYWRGGEVYLVYQSLPDSAFQALQPPSPRPLNPPVLKVGVNSNANSAEEDAITRFLRSMQVSNTDPKTGSSGKKRESDVTYSRVFGDKSVVTLVYQGTNGAQNE